MIMIMIMLLSDSSDSFLVFQSWLMFDCAWNQALELNLNAPAVTVRWPVGRALHNSTNMTWPVGRALHNDGL